MGKVVKKTVVKPKKTKDEIVEMLKLAELEEGRVGLVNAYLSKGWRMANIIIRGDNDHHKFGRTRSEQESNMRKEWGGTMTDEQFDKLKYIEKKKYEIDGSKKNFIPSHHIDNLKWQYIKKYYLEQRQVVI